MGSGSAARSSSGMAQRSPTGATITVGSGEDDPISKQPTSMEVGCLKLAFFCLSLMWTDHNGVEDTGMASD